MVDKKVSIEQKLVFGIAYGDDNIPVITVGIPTGAWEHMKDGLTQHFDLTSVGLPIKFVLFGGKNHDEVKKVLEEAARQANKPYLDMRNKDFSIKEPKKLIK